MKTVRLNAGSAAAIDRSLLTKRLVSDPASSNRGVSTGRADEHWAKLQFNLEHPWDQFVSDFLPERDLESTEFDAALGTIGGGNHFAELQAVEKVFDAAAFKTLGLGKQQLVVLVHSGSRGLGKSILRPHVDQHFGNGVEADSFAAEEYLRGHDFAVR